MGFFKIKWKEFGARLTRGFKTQEELETAVAELRQSGHKVEQVIAPARVKRSKPKSKPRIRGGRGVSIVGVDGVAITVGEKCEYQVYDDAVLGGVWKKGTLERVKLTRHDGALAWVSGKYAPWRMVKARDIRALPDRKLEKALELYPARIEHHEARAAARRLAAA